MTQYHFVSPLLKRSTKQFSIYDENNQEIGYMQRYYKSKLSYILDMIFTGMFLNVKIQDKAGSVIAQTEEKVVLKNFISPTRQSWKVDTNKFGTFELKDKSKIKTHPRYEFFIDNLKYTLKKNFGDRKIYLLNNSEELVAEITYDKITPPQTFKIKINKPELDIHTIACLSYTLILRD